MAKSLTGIGYATQDQIDYRKQLESILNNKKKELVRQQQQEIIKVYEKAYKDIIEKGLKKAGGDKAKIDKLTKVYAEQIYNELELIVNQYNADMSSTIETMQAEIMTSMNIFEKGEYYEFKEAVDKAVNVANRKIVQQMIEGKVYHDGKGLDKRIWDSAKMSGTKMRDAINSCIAQGMGAAEMSQNLKEFAMGGHHTWSRNKIKEKLGDGYARKYSGGLDYEALRLARTTLTHQAQIAVINSSKINPYLQFIKWHSEHQAGRTCQQCIDRDGKLFPIDEVPLDHPNGMCWIQPVYSIDGKTEATPEEIAKDMKAWAEGDKNSKLMDKIPEYKGLGGTKKPAKAAKKTTKKTTKKITKQQTNKDEFNKLTKQQIDSYKKKFSKDMSKQSNINYLDEAAEALKNYPEHIQQAYYKASQHLKGFQETNKDEAWYNPWLKKVCMDADGELKLANDYKYNKFDVWFHETGHMMDHLLQADKDGHISADTAPLSTNESFIKALKKDFGNIKKRIDKQCMDKFKLTKDEYKTKYPTKKDLNKLYTDVLYDEIARNHKTKGIQDVLEGLSNGDIRLGWGHGKKYWNRKDRNKEVASEAWANICGSYCDKETLELMQKYFPTATEELNTIIKNRLKELD